MKILIGAVFAVQLVMGGYFYKTIENQNSIINGVYSTTKNNTKTITKLNTTFRSQVRLNNLIVKYLKHLSREVNRLKVNNGN